MGDVTKIEWTDHTASPWHGCQHAILPGGGEHPGCLNCYAERQSLRNPGILGEWGPDGTRIKSKSFIKNLRLWNAQGEREGRQLKVFPSICDPFEDRPELTPWREEMFEVADECPWIILLLLTKRPENIAKLWFPPNDLQRRIENRQIAGQSISGVLHRENVWLGTSVSDQETADKLITALLKCRDLSPCLFLSAEPLLGPINLRRHFLCRDCESDDRTYDRLPDPCDGKCPRINWVIVGGESGPNARPNDIAWTESIISQCKDSGVACFHKQLGSRHLIIQDPKGGDMSEWPESLRVRQFPQVTAHMHSSDRY